MNRLTTPHTSLLLLALSTSLATAQSRDLDALVVTGSAVAEPLKDAPVRTEVIDREWITRAASRDLASALEFAPGVRVETACGVCNTQQIQMLGLPQSYIAILQDGLPTFTGLAGVYGIEQIPAGLIDRIEVVKGGGSALYGPGAVAGVINLIPREPVENGGYLELRASRTRGNQVANRLPYDITGMYDWVLPDHNLAITAFANTSYVRPIDISGDGFTDVAERDFLAAGLRALWTPGPGTRLSLDFLHAGEDRRGGEAGPAFSGPANLAMLAEEIKSRRQTLALKLGNEITPEWETQLAYAYSRNRRDSYYGGTAALGSPDPLSPFFDPTWDPSLGYGDTTNDLHFFDASLAWTPNDDHRLTLGAQYRNETLTDRQATIGRLIDERYELFGLLAQHRWKINDIFTAETGARVDFHSEVDNAILSPRATLMVEPRHGLRIRNSLGWGFRAPEIFDEDLHISNVGGDLQVINRDPSLKEETAVTFSVAPEWNITDRLRFESNFFHTWLDDAFVINPDPTGMNPDADEFLKTNAGRARIYGAEFNLGYFADDWRLELSWTEQRQQYGESQLLLGDDTFADPADNPIFSRRFPRTPRHLGLIRYTHEGPWFDTFIAAKLTGPMLVPHVISDVNTGDQIENRLRKTPWFFNLDVGISKTFDIREKDQLAVSLGIRNLLDDYQSDLERGAFRDADYVYGPAFPRTFHAGVRWEF
jgi:outer membrane receptor for ferrienterochelin and colicins